MSRRVFVDASAWLARLDAREAAHDEMTLLLDAVDGTICTTNHVLDEVLTFASRRYGHASAVALGTALRNPRAVELVHVTPDDELRAFELFRARPDQRYSFTDCTSFVVMRRLGIDTAVTLDQDFRNEGFTVLP